MIFPQKSFKQVLDNSSTMSTLLSVCFYYRIKILKILAILLILNIPSCFGDKKQKPGPGNFPASEFPKELEWFNTKQPINLQNFRGNILILFFWTGSNLKSLDILEKINTFELENKENIRFIAVHTPRFSGESSSDYLRNLLIKNKIDTLTVQDSKFSLWRTYGINSWNSLLLISEEGKVIGRFSVDPSLVRVDPIFEKLFNLDTGNQSDKPRTETERELERSGIPESILSYPEKIILDETGKILYISDSNHNRILIVNRDTGFILDSIGSGVKGFDNGTYNQSSFNYPTGLSLIGNSLYIVDRNNHSIRKVDLEKKIVTLFSGTGEKGDEVVHDSIAPVTSFSYPSDLSKEGNLLYVSNTGFNQFLKIDTNSGKIESLFPQYKDMKNTNNFFSKMGLHHIGNTIYFTDSGASALKSITSDVYSKTKILIGNKKGEYGDLDGDSTLARLQFPKSIFAKNNKVFISDTLNHKIKVFDTGKRTVKTLAGTGKIGSKNGSALQSSFNEPSGIYLFKDDLYIADTNNHSIRVVNLLEEKTTTFHLRADRDFFLNSKKKVTPLEVTIPHKSLFLNKNLLTISLKIDLSKKYEWDKNSPFYFKVSSSDNSILSFSGNESNYFENFSGETEFFPTMIKEGNTELSIDGIVSYCEKESASLCYYKKFRVNTILKFSSKTDDKPIIKIKIPFKE